MAREPAGLRLLLPNQKRIYAYILTLVPHWSDADDLMQETTTVMWREFGEFEPGTDFVAWGVGIARYEAQLLIGSEDAVKVWLNRREVHNHFVRRSPAQLGQDVVTVNLKQGRNLLLVKLEQISGGGGLIAALRVRHDVQFTRP